MKDINNVEDRYHRLFKKFTNQTEFAIEDLLEKAVIFYDAYSSLPTDHFVRFCDAACLDELHQIFLHKIGERHSQLRNAIGSQAGAFALLDLLINNHHEYFDFMMLMVAPAWAKTDATSLLDSLVRVANKVGTRPQSAH